MAQLPKPAMSEDNNETGGFAPIPEGDYTAAIVASHWKDTKAKTGKMLVYKMKIMDGQYAGKFLFENLNLINPNPVAVEIANKTNNSICKACGCYNVEDSEELHGILFGITVKVEPASANYPANNKITKYFSLQDEAEGTPGDGALPWE
jgi:hypothetical protein